MSFYPLRTRKTQKAPRLDPLPTFLARGRSHNPLPSRGGPGRGELPNLRSSALICGLLLLLCISLLSAHRVAASNRSQEASAAGVSIAAGELSGVIQVANGWRHTCALLSNGQVKCWGWNLYGQLGNNSTADSVQPQAVHNLSNVLQIAAGDSHNCAVMSDHTIQCWGRNNAGQVGDGAFTQRPEPVAVQNINNADKVYAAGWISCALLLTKQVKCWGNNEHYAMSDGTTTNQPSPVLIPNINSAVMLAVGGGHVCAVLETGGVLCWGDSVQGQQGDGSTSSNLSPTAVSGISDAKAINAGRSHTCVLHQDNTVSCWGSNDGGQIGDGTVNDHLTPYKVPGASNGIAVAAASFFLNQINDHIGHSCVLKSDFTVQCWGSNKFGQLGDGTTTSSTSPQTVPGLSGVRQLDASVEHTCALLADSGVKCWGSNDYLQLGHNSNNKTPNPVKDGNCYTLTVTAVNNGGTPTTTPARSAASQCASGSFAPGETITVQANPNQGWTVSKWNGAPSSSPTYTFIMPSYNYAVSVEYAAQNCYTLQLTKSGSGADLSAVPGQSNGCTNPHEYVSGENITLTASPANNWQVGGWSGTSNDSSTDATNSLTMPASNHTVGVIYIQFTPTPTPTTPTPTTPTVATATPPTLTPPTSTPTTSTPPTSTPPTPTPTTSSAATMTPTPATPTTLPTPKPCFTLSLSHTGSGSDPVASPANSEGCDPNKYSEGENISLSASPAAGWIVSSWSGTNDVSTKSAANSVTMPAEEHAVSVTYEQQIRPTPGPVLLPLILAQPTSEVTPPPTWVQIGLQTILSDTSALALEGNTLYVSERGDHERKTGGLYKAALLDCPKPLNFGPVFRTRPSLDVAFDDEWGLSAPYNNTVFVSSNRGEQWTPKPLPELTARTRTVVFANSGLYAGTESHGLFKSQNGGETWTSLGTEPRNINVLTNIADVVWIGANVSGGNGGLWRLNNDIPVNQSAGLRSDVQNVWDIVYNDDVNYYFLATDHGLYKSQTGAAWELVTTETPSLYSLAFVDDALYAGTLKSGVLRLNSEQTNWTNVVGGDWNAKLTVRDLWYDDKYCHGLIAATDYGVWLWK
ncbi:MAG: hypothetical protein R2911_34775 [Caldilineaceae bacterium]